MKKTNGLITVAVIGVLLAGAFFIYRQYYPVYGGGYGGHHMGGGMGFMIPLFWIILIAAIVSVLGSSSHNPREQGRPLPDLPDALEILKQRYAKGEIDKSEFRTKVADLSET